MNTKSEQAEAELLERTEDLEELKLELEELK